MEPSNDDVNDDGKDDVKNNYVSQWEPIANIEHSERAEKPVLYA